MELRVGESQQASFVVFTCGGKPNNATYRWSSSLPSVASVDSLTGVVTGVSAGSAVIHVEPRDEGLPVSGNIGVKVFPATGS
jgi:uncharacterized protein YjdB